MKRMRKQEMVDYIFSRTKLRVDRVWEMKCENDPKWITKETFYEPLMKVPKRKLRKFLNTRNEFIASEHYYAWHHADTYYDFILRDLEYGRELKIASDFDQEIYESIKDS